MSKSDGSEYRRKLAELAGRLQDFQISKMSRSRKSCGSAVASSPTPSEQSCYGFSKSQSMASLPVIGTQKKSKKEPVGPERIKELETVEAQMANIAQSLSQKRRRQSSLISKNSKEIMKEVYDMKKLLATRESIKESLRNGTKPYEIISKNPGSSDESEENERSLILQHLARSQVETEQRRRAVHAIQMALESLEYSNRSHSKTEAAKADLQNQLENEEVNLKCLKEEQKGLLQLLTNQVMPCTKPEFSLSVYRYIKEDPDGYQIRNAQFVYNPTKPCVRFEVDESGHGVYVNMAEEGTRLVREDRVLEVNALNVFSSTLEETLAMIIPGLNHVTVLRRIAKDSDYHSELKNFQEKYNAIQREREVLKQENMKQSHRITYLEDQVSEMEGACAELRAAGEIIHAETENLLKQIRGGSENPEPDSGKIQKLESGRKQTVNKVKPPRTSLLKKGDSSDSSSIKSDPKSESSKSDEILPSSAHYSYQQPELTASDFVVHHTKKSDISHRRFKSRGIDSYSGRHIHHHEALYATTDIVKKAYEPRCETPTDTRSIVSADNYREKHTVSMGYSSDLDRTMPRDKKKSKPPVPRKPSFLSNKSSSLQSVERRQEEFINGYEINPSGYESMSSVRSEKSGISLPSFKWPLLSGKKMSVH